MTLSIVPFGLEDDAHQIGKIDIWNLGRNTAGTYDYAAVQIKRAPFREALAIAEGKGLLRFDKSGIVIGAEDHEDEDIRIVHVRGHDRTRRDAYDLLYRALIVLGYRDRNPEA